MHICFLWKLKYNVWVPFHAQPSPGTVEEFLSNPCIPRESDLVQHTATLHCELPYYGYSRVRREREHGEKAITGKESPPVLLKPCFCLLSSPSCLPKDRALISVPCSPEHLALPPDIWNAKNHNETTKGLQTACGWIKNEAAI